MAVKWSYPGIGFSEVDNSIQANYTVADGVGAIVLNANRGYVNQRVLSTSIKKFHENFGDPETENDYGHFAADLYLQASPQLYAVRATQGDEAYGFIQFPYEDAAAKDCKIDALIQQFEYVDNEGDTQIKLLDPMKGHTEYTNIKDANWQTFTAFNNKAAAVTPDNYEGVGTNSAFCLVDDGYALYYHDLKDDLDPSIRIIRDDTSAGLNDYPSGTYYKVLSPAGGDAYKLFTNAKSELASNNTFVFSAENVINDAGDNIKNKPYMFVNSANYVNNTWFAQLTVPANLTLNNEETTLQFYIPSGSVGEFNKPTDTQGKKAITAVMQALGTVDEIKETGKVFKANFFDWNEESTIEEQIVPVSAYENKQQVLGSQFREITGALYNQQLVLSGKHPELSGNVFVDVEDCYLNDLSGSDAAKYNHYKTIVEQGYSAYPISAIPYETAKQLAYNQYGKDVSEVYTSSYNVFESVDPVTNTLFTRILFASNPGDEDEKNDSVFISPYIFNTYFDKDQGVAGKQVIKSAYISRHPEPIYQPWTFDKNPEEIKRLVAFPTSDIVNDPTGMYKDGYTRTILTVDEPGNGDIERYDSAQNNQLVIASVGPGEYGNDIGVSIITPAVAGNMALTDQPAAFNWKYQFDDEDLVDKDWIEHPSYKDNPNNLTWKKVYKINVYVKSKTQQASVWGSGLDALVKEPVESFLVSNDPQVKDGNGNSMYAPYVINGQSKYIYVSLNSVLASRTAIGTYAMPKQTYSIYQLTGGRNSKKNNISEKTAALELYRDRQKCDADIIFNVEPIETFQSRQKYAAMQNRIANIAIDRGMDIGFIQVTSKAAKTGYKALSEGKLFTFQNGSYVSCQAGYDRYYDQYTSSWVYLPKSVAVAIAHARCWRAGTPWMAPAGVTNGTIDYSNGQLLKLSDPEIGQLYDANINCSRSCAGYGEVIYGQKTALKKTSALNRINVRGLLNYIEKHLENMLVPFLFQNNTSTTRSTMLSTVDSFLSNIMAAGGIIAKSVVVKPDPDDSHLVYVNIKIIPAEAIEFIQVTTTVNRQNSTISSTEG